MKLRYLGKKPLPYVLNTPIPFIAKSDRDGEVAFTPDGEIKDEWGQFLLDQCAGAFERVDQPLVVPDQAPRLLCQADVEQILKYVGKRFSGKAGKWNAIAFIKKHHAEEVLGLRKLQIMTSVIHWELVPIALADVKVSDLPEMWNKGKVGLKRVSSKQRLAQTLSQEAVTEPSEGFHQVPVPAMQEG